MGKINAWNEWKASKKDIKNQDKQIEKYHKENPSSYEKVYSPKELKKQTKHSEKYREENPIEYEMNEKQIKSFSNPRHKEHR